MVHCCYIFLYRVLDFSFLKPLPFLQFHLLEEGINFHQWLRLNIMFYPCSSHNERYTHCRNPLIFLRTGFLFLQCHSCYHFRNISSWMDTLPFVSFYYWFKFIILLFWHYRKCHICYTTRWITPIIFLRGFFHFSSPQTLPYQLLE